MSQHSVKNGRYEIVWGIEPECGYYISVFDTFVDEDDEAYVVLNKDEVQENITEDDVIALATDFGANSFYVARTLLLDMGL